MDRAIVFEDLGRVAVRPSEPLSAPGRDEVLVAPSFLGICGSDLHVLHGRHPWIRPPLTTGHEMAGVVLEAGTDATLAVGDHVVLNPLVACGTCPACRSGHPNHCAQAAVIGFRLPGAGAERVVLAEAQLHRVDPRLPLETASLIEPLATGWHAAGLPRNLERVLVIGGGTIGLSVLLALRARGAGPVTIVEPVAAKRELALILGADRAAAPDEVAPEPAFSAVFDCVTAQATLDLACAATINGGAVVMVGVPAGPLALPVPRMQRFEIALLGSGMYAPADIEAAIAAVGDGSIDPSRLISAVYPLADAPEAYATAGNGQNVKTLIAFA